MGQNVQCKQGLRDDDDDNGEYYFEEEKEIDLVRLW